MRYLFIILIFCVSNKLLSQEFRESFYEPQKLNKRILKKILSSNVNCKTYYATGDYVIKDSLMITVIKGYSKNDTVYHVGIVIEGSKIRIHKIIPHAVIQDRQRIILGDMYTDYYEACLKFEIRKINHINISALEDKFELKEEDIIESREEVLCK